jgi:hypothetical protein
VTAAVSIGVMAYINLKDMKPGNQLKTIIIDKKELENSMDEVGIPGRPHIRAFILVQSKGTA